MDDATPAVPSPLSDHLRTEVDALAAMLPSPPATAALPVSAAAGDDAPPPTARVAPPVADAWRPRPPATRPPPDALPGASLDAPRRPVAPGA